MPGLWCDVLVAGGGTGGVAAALAACAHGYRVVLTEETDWVGGQLTSQAVPPDEHPWIERFGCTRRYRQYRNEVRDYYRRFTPLKPEYRADAELNPGGGWVSRLCHEPRIGHQVLLQMLQPALASGLLTLLLEAVPVDADTEGDCVRAVRFRSLRSGEETLVEAAYVLDATELGDLLPMTGTEYVIGAESKDETQEPNAVDGPSQPNNLQGITWCFPVALDEGSHRVIDRPEKYSFWREYRPEFWPGQHLGFDILHPQTLRTVHLPLRAHEGDYTLTQYRQIVDPTKYGHGGPPHVVTLANWPMNDYFLESPLGEDGKTDHRERVFAEAKELSRCVLYWLQTEAPRHDGGVGYPGLYLVPSLVGTEDGFAKYPYIREGRRLRARKTVLEQEVAAYTNPGRDRAVEFSDSVGVGAYRIDLHPSTSGANTIDTSTLPFQIPLGSLVPVRMRNLLAAGKNLGVTHITNGCYRLHPVEWNVGESAGLLAAWCLSQGSEPAQVADAPEDFQKFLHQDGVETRWPTLHAL